MKTYVIIDLKGSFVKKVEGARLDVTDHAILVYGESSEIVAIAPLQNVTAVTESE